MPFRHHPQGCVDSFDACCWSPPPLLPLSKKNLPNCLVARGSPAVENTTPWYYSPLNHSPQSIVIPQVRPGGFLESITFQIFTFIAPLSLRHHSATPTTRHTLCMAKRIMITICRAHTLLLDNFNTSRVYLFSNISHSQDNELFSTNEEDHNCWFNYKRSPQTKTRLSPARVTQELNWINRVTLLSTAAPLLPAVVPVRIINRVSIKSGTREQYCSMLVDRVSLATL